MAKEDCVICGDDHPRCNGHKKIDEDTPEVRPCMVWPRDTEDVCRFHGGNNPRIKAAGAARRAAKAARKDAGALLGYDLDGTVPNPLAMIEGIAAMELATLQALSERVNALREVRYGSEVSTEQLRSEVVLLERSRDRAMKYLEVLLKHQPDGEAAASVNLLTSLSDQIKAMAAPE